jgi:hypothetical protein
MMDKYEFITQLIDRDKVKLDQREKIVKLAAREIELDRGLGIVLESRVAELEKKLETIQNKQSSVSSLEQGNSNSPNRPEDIIEKEDFTYINPIHLSSYLREFNTDSVLMCTTHDIDDDTLKSLCEEIKTDRYDFHKMIKAARKRCWILNNNFKDKINKNIIARINTYLLGIKKGTDKGWSEDNIKMTWNSLALLQWVAENPGFPPNPDVNLARDFGKSGFEFRPIKTDRFAIDRMSLLVKHFKNTIRINHENNLIDILDSVNKKNGWDKELNLEYDAHRKEINFELFTDVDKMKQCYKDIIRMVLDIPVVEGHDKHLVRIGFSYTEKEVIFSIHHINSVFKKTPENLLERLGQKHKALRDKANGLCDLYLNADFGQKRYARINLLDHTSRTAIMIPKFEGVEHEMIFRR